MLALKQQAAYAQATAYLRFASTYTGEAQARVPQTYAQARKTGIHAPNITHPRTPFTAMQPLTDEIPIIIGHLDMFNVRMFSEGWSWKRLGSRDVYLLRTCTEAISLALPVKLETETGELPLVIGAIQN